MRFTLIDITVIGSELVVLAIAYLLLLLAIKLLFRRLMGLPVLRSHPQLLTAGQNKISQLLIILWIICSLFVIAINMLLLYREQDLLPLTLGFIQRLPSSLWLDLGRGVLQSSAILAITIAIQKPINHLLERTNQFCQNWDRFTSNDESINKFFQELKRLFRDGLWLTAILLCSRAFQFTTISSYLLVLLKIYIAIAAAILLFKASDAIIDSLDAFSDAYMDRNVAFQAYRNLRNLIPFVKRCIEYAIYIGTATLVVDQINPLSSLAAVGTKAIKILGIILACRILIEVTSVFVSEFLIGRKKLSDDQQKRRMTLVPILQSAAKYGIYFWAGVLILRVIEIDPAPILATAGIVGLAIGFGAQNLINDTVSGFFILLENYYLVGDYIVVDESEGVVESIELRTTRIRHPNGQLQILRNGDITSIVNYSREFIYAVVDIGVAYDSDLNHVYRVIDAIGVDLQNQFPDDVLEPTSVDGVEAFHPAKIMVRTVTKLKPNNSRRGVHDDIQGELRKILKEAFDQAGIVIPVSQTVGVLAPSEEG